MAAERGWNQVIGLLQDHGGTEVSRPQETQRGVSPCGPLSKQEYSWPWLRGGVTQTQATSASVVQLRWASLPTGTQIGHISGQGPRQMALVSGSRPRGAVAESTGCFHACN